MICAIQLSVNNDEIIWKCPIGWFLFAFMQNTGEIDDLGTAYPEVFTGSYCIWGIIGSPSNRNMDLITVILPSMLLLYP